jgi:sarcosine oxidase subunit alpha
LRIKNHPIINFTYKKKISFNFNNKKITGYESDCIASALHAQGIKILTKSLKYDLPRGFFCGIGKCSSCLMRVNGIPNVRTCIVPLKQGINVEMQDKFGKLPSAKFKEKSKEILNVEVLVVGAGPAGLCAAIEAAKQGANVLLVDENMAVGGQLIKQTHKFFGSENEKAGTRGIIISESLKKEIDELKKAGQVKLMLNSTVIGYYEGEKNLHKFIVIKRKNYDSVLIEVNSKTVVLACGAMENMLIFPGNDLPGVYGAGAVQTLMNVFGVKPGKKVLMVGAGNVGLIVSYQLLQAGIDVACVVEAMPSIGGYHVHAAKLRRCGVPIFTSHSIKEVVGRDYVESAVVVKLNKNWQPINGSEKKITCDTVCLAVGLTPSTRLLNQIGVKMDFVNEAGGYIAIHNNFMQTNKKGIFVAGDSSGIEEASTAMIEGKIAGISAALLLRYKDGKKLLSQYIEDLKKFREGPFGEKARIAKKKIEKLVEEK